MMFFILKYESLDFLKGDGGLRMYKLMTIVILIGLYGSLQGCDDANGVRDCYYHSQYHATLLHIKNGRYELIDKDEDGRVSDEGRCMVDGKKITLVSEKPFSILGPITGTVEDQHLRLHLLDNPEIKFVYLSCE